MVRVSFKGVYEYLPMNCPEEHTTCSTPCKRCGGVWHSFTNEPWCDDCGEPSFVYSMADVQEMIRNGYFNA